jgi:hypothetical protein
MRRAMLVAMTAAMTVGFAAPALADYVRLGDVDVGYRTDLDTAYSRFGGPVESLRFTADRNDVFCRSIRVRYANGQMDDVFHGRLSEDRPVDVDVQGRARRIDSVDFVCRSDGYRGAKIYIAADVGRYRDEWRRDRNWDRMWSGLFGMGPGMHGPGDRHDRDGMMGSDDWISLGVESFEGRNDKESTFAGGWRGHSVDRIALRPLNADARCMRVVVTYQSGRKQKVENYLPGVMERGRLAVINLPGRDRDIRDLFMRCRAVNDYSVRIEILVRK